METRKTVKQLSSGKAPGAIPAEVYKAVGGGGLSMAQELIDLFTVCGVRMLSHKNLRMHP